MIHDETDDLLADTPPPADPPAGPAEDGPAADFLANTPPLADPPAVPDEVPPAPIFAAADGTDVTRDPTPTNQNPKDTLPTKTDFALEEFIEILEFFLDASSFKLGNAVIRAITGIFMGPSSSPTVANASLVMDEKTFLCSISPSARSAFRMVYRYIDDILQLNCEKFLELAPKIYHPELSLGSVTK